MLVLLPSSFLTSDLDNLFVQLTWLLPTAASWSDLLSSPERLKVATAGGRSELCVLFNCSFLSIQTGLGQACEADCSHR